MNIKKLSEHEEKYWEYNKQISDIRNKALIKTGYKKIDGEVWITLTLIGIGLIIPMIFALG
tara:strand:- start:174 stop:356 length:183 start_codon:yes stop_codon:yes gene_type:complete